MDPMAHFKRTDRAGRLASARLALKNAAKALNESDDALSEAERTATPEAVERATESLRTLSETVAEHARLAAHFMSKVEW